jgi:hypothetical protein
MSSTSKTVDPGASAKARTARRASSRKIRYCVEPPSIFDSSLALAILSGLVSLLLSIYFGLDDLLFSTVKRSRYYGETVPEFLLKMFRRKTCIARSYL